MKIFYIAIKFFYILFHYNINFRFKYVRYVAIEIKIHSDGKHYIDCFGSFHCLAQFTLVEIKAIF